MKPKRASRRAEKQEQPRTSKILQRKITELELRIGAAESLQEIISMINAQVPLDELLHRAVRLAAIRQRAGACVLHHFDLKNEIVVQVASCGMEGIFQDGLVRSFSELGPSGGSGYLEALERRYPIYQNYPPYPERVEIIRQAQDIPEPIKAERIALRSRYAASFAVPIYLQETLYGGMVFYYSEPQQFREEQIQLGLAFGEQIAVALQNAYLLSEMQQRRKIAEGFREIIRKINGTESLQEVLDLIVGRTENILECQSSALYICEDSCIRLQALRGEFPIPVPTIVANCGEGIIGKAVAEKQRIIIPDLSQNDADDRADSFGLEASLYIDPIHYQLDAAIHGSFKALLVEPLFSQERTFGALAFYYRDIHRFDQDELDLAEVFAIQASLAIENTMLRKQAIQVAASAERERLARDLHDSVSQSLFSANLIAQSLPQLWQTRPERATEELNNLLKLTQGAQSEMRGLLFELRPKALESVMLRDLAEHAINSFAGKTLIPVEADIELNAEIPLTVKIAAYRILQETLNNIAKHAKARKVTIELKGDGEGFSLMLQDDGKGFAPSHGYNGGQGLSIMEERARLAGARLTIDSEPGKGTRVFFKWPGE
ncbi:GAF domain-containing sensor histidine kinase [Gracilinema caldarium]|uniref:GAF domain-containing sensor histidine kinase n=1 Tax=Gracilinema caldarium TaxID=215591 RepID=UPI0026F2E74C|nr:GAF domain-containing sensor histidine kinase [Gracilinema caldarium]